MKLSLPPQRGGVSIPANNLQFIMQISKALAENEPQLTFEFLIECFTGLSKISNIPAKLSAIRYMSPWISNLKMLFTKPPSDVSSGSAHDSIGENRERCREILNFMIELTIREPEVC